MLSKRLLKAISLIDKNSKIIDIGTDHAYVPIYLYKNNITKNIVASDISKNVIESARLNLIKNDLEDKIKLIVSDGFKNIHEEFDTAIIMGMGTHTIIDILKEKNLPNKLIISSHNEQYLLRKTLYDLGYYIEKEEVVFENNKYYVIIKFVKGIKKITDNELLFGISNNKEYYKYLVNHYQKIYEVSKNNKYLEYINYLNDIIKKRQD